MELSGRIFSDFCDFHHFTKLLEVAGDQVEERELVKVLRALIAHLDNLDGNNILEIKLNLC